jgi:undecaprenyl-diphosphatase
MNTFLGAVEHIDYSIFHFINQFALRNSFLDQAAVFFAENFQYVVILFLCLFLLKDFKKYFKMVASAIFAAIFSRFVITEIIRYSLPRARPFIEEPLAKLLAYHNPDESSFPSGHASFFFALATVVYLYDKRLGILFFISALLISIPRVFIGVHWPSDIIAGAIVGIFTGWLVFKAAKKIIKK